MRRKFLPILLTLVLATMLAAPAAFAEEGATSDPKFHPDYTLLGKTLQKVTADDMKSAGDKAGMDSRVLDYYGPVKGDVYRLDTRVSIADWPADAGDSVDDKTYQWIIYNHVSIPEKKGEIVSAIGDAYGGYVYEYGYGDFAGTGMGDFEDNEKGASVGALLGGGALTRDSADTAGYIETSFWIDVPAGAHVAISEATKNDPAETELIVSDPAAAEILSEGGASYTVGSGKPFVVQSPRSMSGEGFTALIVDGNEIALTKTSDILWEGAQGKVEEGSTKATLYADYLDTLSAGNHTVTLAYADGNNATVGLSILARADEPKTGSPQTGDTTTPALIALLMAASAAGLFAALMRRRKLLER
ncbi:MAG: LPXTG cell wall anchor domain-containing protein [Clostridiales Family XIII bacterium]|jgi:LPXTG-motif cell wall-anchored protein|nr:LPXTG cell wall anchor domain-containing protein [Clostridiales Family XIII bacterium]